MQMTATERRQLQESLGLPAHDELNDVLAMLEQLTRRDDRDVVLRVEEETVIEFDWPADAELDFDAALQAPGRKA